MWSPRAEPAQSLRSRVVVDAEVLRDPADASASVVHRAADGCDDLVDRDDERVRNAKVTEKTTEVSESFSPRPPDLTTLFCATYEVRRPNLPEAHIIDTLFGDERPQATPPRPHISPNSTATARHQGARQGIVGTESCSPGLGPILLL